MIDQDIFTETQYAYCVKRASDIERLARFVPFIILIVIMQLVFSVLFISVEFSMFYNMAEFMGGGEEEGEGENVFSNMDVVSIGLILMIAFHIISTIYKNNPAVKLVRFLVVITLAIFIIGAGSTFALNMLPLIESMLETDDTGKYIPPAMMSFIKEDILPNGAILMPLGMIGFSAICITCADYFFNRLCINIKHIFEVTEDKKAAKAFIKRIKEILNTYAFLSHDNQNFQSNIDQRVKAKALIIALLISQSAAGYEKLVMLRELFPDEKDVTGEFATLLNEDDDQTRLIKKMSLPALKDRLDDLKKYTEKVILEIINRDQLT